MEADYVSDSDLDSVIRRLSLLDEQAKSSVQLDDRVIIPSHASQSPRFKCAPGKCVELSDGSFMRISSVLRDNRGNIFVKGDHLIRQNFRGLIMSKRRNEVILVRQRLQSTDNSQALLHEVPIEQIVRNRQVIFTNQRFPLLSGRDDDASVEDPTVQVEIGPLYCRWVHTTVIDDMRRSNDRRRSTDNIIESLSPEEADLSTRTTRNGAKRDTRITRREARRQWRGFPSIRGGSHVGFQYTYNVDGTTVRRQVRSYTFGDAFCGAGGASRGAVDAGLAIRWSFDNNAAAIASHRQNFERHGCDCRHESVDEFINRLLKMDEAEKQRIQIDVLHISPPCQPFSPAHTIASPERDEMNEAALLSVWQLIEYLKPRVVTLEETEGLPSRHAEWFSLLINIFTSLGYSVRWKVVQCKEYGIPQTRKRLLIIAAGPGEKLPPFPEPTHGDEDRSVKPFATINSTIGEIPVNAKDHDQTIQFADRGTRTPFDGNIQAKTITTNAGQENYHPSGRRPYTLRELARLQTFPLLHSFDGANGITEKKRQIGNAVPPLLARAMFRSVVKSLKESDGV
jgi:DNA (cytosine-5)-methyltransferase 1